MGGRGSVGIKSGSNKNVKQDITKNKKTNTYKVENAVESVEKQLGIKLQKSVIGKEKRGVFSFDGIITKGGKLESFSKSGIEENVTLATIQSLAKKSGKYRIESNGVGRYALVVNKTKSK